MTSLLGTPAYKNKASAPPPKVPPTPRHDHRGVESMHTPHWMTCPALMHSHSMEPIYFSPKVWLMQIALKLVNHKDICSALSLTPCCQFSRHILGSRQISTSPRALACHWCRGLLHPAWAKKDDNNFPKAACQSFFEEFSCEKYGLNTFKLSGSWLLFTPG